MQVTILPFCLVVYSHLMIECNMCYNTQFQLRIFSYFCGFPCPIMTDDKIVRPPVCVLGFRNICPATCVWLPGFALKSTSGTCSESHEVQ